MPPSVARTASPALSEVAVGDPAAAWAAAGFTIDTDRAVTQVGAVRVRLSADTAEGSPGDERGIRSWSFAPEGPTGLRGPNAGTGLRGGLLDGLPTGAPVAVTGPPPVHPNGATVLDHVVVLSPDVDRTTDAFAGVGLDVRRVRRIPSSTPARVQVFFRAGEVIIELVGPERARGDGPATFYGLAFTVADLDATAAVLGDRLSEIRPAVQSGRRIATLRHRDLGLSVPVAFLSQRAQEDAPRAGESRT
jgi:hypothetical protein